jgi:four helix bundle protein
MKNSEFSAEMKKRIYKLITEILKFVNKVDWRTVCLGDAREQLTTACTSIGANYIEAIGCVTSKDFSRFLGHACRSSNETQYWLLLIRDVSESNDGQINRLVDETMQISRILGSAIKTIRAKNPR